MRPTRNVLLFVAVQVICLCLSSAPAAAQAAKPSHFELEYVGSTMWGGIYDMVGHGDYLYCAIGNGIQVLDVSDPANPVLAKQVYLNRVAKCLDIRDSLLYVGFQEGYLQVFDVHDPVGLESLVDFAVAWDDVSLPGVSTVVAAQDRVYLATNNGLCIVDLSDMNSPRVLGTFVAHPLYPAIHGLAVVGNTVYLGGPLTSVDVSDPVHPS